MIRHFKVISPRNSCLSRPFHGNSPIPSKLVSTYHMAVFNATPSVCSVANSNELLYIVQEPGGSDSCARRECKLFSQRASLGASATIVLRTTIEHSTATLTTACRARARAAVLGAFVADAAAMPLHWIYSPEDIRRKVGSADAAFLEPPESPFYKYPVGKLSPFGFEAMTVLQSVVNRGGINVRPAVLQAVPATVSPQLVRQPCYLVLTKTNGESEDLTRI